MVPPLPPELLAYIIKLSLPALAFSTFPERYETLLSFHLVNKAWSALARTELFLHISVQSWNQGEELIKQVLQGSLDEKLGRTKSLWMGTCLPEGQQPESKIKLLKLEKFEPLMKRLHTLEKLAASYALVLESDLKHVQGVASLLFFHTRLGSIRLPHTTTPLALAFSSLKQLDWIDSKLVKSFAPDWTSFLVPSIFPQLRAFSFAAHAESYLDKSIEHAWRSIAHQLESFTFIDGGLHNVPELDLIWSKFSHLQHLMMCLWGHAYCDYIPALRQRPESLLRSIEFIATYGIGHITILDALVTFTAAVVGSPSLFSNLKQMTFRGWRLDGEQAEMNVEAHDALKRQLGDSVKLEISDEMIHAGAWEKYIQ